MESKSYCGKRYTSSDLHVAVYVNDIKLIQQCVRNKNIINSFWRGCTSVSSALYRKRYEILQILVHNGASVNLCTHNDKMEPPLFAACRLKDTTAIHIILQSLNLNVNQKDFFGRTALWAAARYCSADVVESLLDRGAEVNHYDSSRRLPINGAFLNKKDGIKIVQLLVQHGSVLDDLSEDSPLRWCVNHGDPETFQLLIIAGCKIKQDDDLCIKSFPDSWLNDSSFCQWFESFQKTPLPLLQLCVGILRSIISNKSPTRTLHLSQIDKLYIPDSLKKAILLKHL